MNNHTTPTPDLHPSNLYGKPLFDVDGRVAGFILERNDVAYLDKRISEERHLYRNFNGFGIGDKVLSDAIAQGARYARFHDDQLHTLYLADLALFRTRGVEVDQGYGKQWILPLRYWTVPDGQRAEVATGPAAGPQLALFGMVTA